MTGYTGTGTRKEFLYRTCSLFDNGNDLSHYRGGCKCKWVLDIYAVINFIPETSPVTQFYSSVTYPGLGH